MVTHQLTYLEKKVSKRIFLVLTIIYACSYPVLAQQGTGFIENLGQYPEEVLFYTDFNGGRIFVEATGMTYAFHEPAANKFTHDHNGGRAGFEQKDNYAVKLTFLEAEGEQEVSYGRQLATIYNYYFVNASFCIF